MSFANALTGRNSTSRAASRSGTTTPIDIETLPRIYDILPRGTKIDEVVQLLPQLPELIAHDKLRTFVGGIGAVVVSLSAGLGMLVPFAFAGLAVGLPMVAQCMMRNQKKLSQMKDRYADLGKPDLKQLSLALIRFNHEQKREQAEAARTRRTQRTGAAASGSAAATGRTARPQSRQSGGVVRDRAVPRSVPSSGLVATAASAPRSAPMTDAQISAEVRSRLKAQPDARSLDLSDLEGMRRLSRRLALAPNLKFVSVSGEFYDRVPREVRHSLPYKLIPAS